MGVAQQDQLERCVDNCFKRYETNAIDVPEGINGKAIVLGQGCLGVCNDLNGLRIDEDQLKAAGAVVNLRNSAGDAGILFRKTDGENGVLRVDEKLPAKLRTLSQVEPVV